nr:alkaline phosphatase [Teredinibacter haidensis]
MTINIMARKLFYRLISAYLLIQSPLLWADWLDQYPDSAQLWYQPAADKVAARAADHENLGRAKAKNIILFVGDGMGVSTITAARIFAGQQKGLQGEEYELSFDRFPYTGLSRTYNTNMQTPDSAGTMTALVTGVKSKAGVLSVNDKTLRQNCASQKGNELLSALALAEIAGKSTGIVSTARVTHATPAATYAHSVERNWENDSEMPAEASAQGCEDIASQLIGFDLRLNQYVSAHAQNRKIKKGTLKSIDGPDVVLGGGLRNFLPGDKTVSFGDVQVKGKRKDGRNLIAEWQQKYPNGKFVSSSAGLKQAVAARPEKLFGLFSESHMAYDARRKQMSEDSAVQAKQPSLVEMTEAAIEMLAQNNKGFFLMVEAGRIDHAHHAGNAFNALSDTVALSDAVAAAVRKTSKQDTLIIVTADHSHVFTIAGYPQRGNPILGKVISPDDSGLPQTKFSLDANGNPYTTLGYMNGRGMAFNPGNADADKRYNQPINTGRQNILSIATEDMGYHQEALVGMGSETHGGEDVAIYGVGPGAYLLSGSHEQNVIFHVMNYAGALVSGAEQALEK